MIKPQDINEKKFGTVLLRGYDPAEVDSFMQDIANDLALLQKENATLRAKMKVLVDKVEEYRGNEDALRMAVLSAQRLGNIIEREARDKAETLVNEATESADKVTKEARLEVEMEKAKLAEAKMASAQFVDNMELLCNRQMAFLATMGQTNFIQEGRAAAKIVDVMPDAEDAAPAAAPAGEIHETVKTIEETVAKAADEPVSVVRPSISRGFALRTDPEDDLEKTTQFSFDGFEK